MHPETVEPFWHILLTPHFYGYLTPYMYRWRLSGLDQTIEIDAQRR